MRALIVTPDDWATDVVRHLSALGIEVSRASSYAVARGTLEAIAVDILIFDWEMDGRYLELLSRIQPNVWVSVVVNRLDTNPEDIGADYMFLKPIHMPTVGDAVAEHLKIPTKSY